MHTVENLEHRVDTAIVALHAALEDDDGVPADEVRAVIDLLDNH